MASREDWIGRTGAEWARRGAALERLLGPAGEAGLQALGARPGERVLDVGCGAGTSTEELAKAVGQEGHVTGVDVSPDLLAIARDRLEGYANVTLLEADAERADLGPPAGALYSRFGSMFFDDPPAAFQNLAGALVPDARAVFVAWREPARNQWASVPMTFSAEGLIPAAPPPGPGPFAWADPGVFQPLLEQAGFRDIRMQDHEFMAEISEGEDPNPVVRSADFMMRIGPMAARLRGATEEAKAEAREFLCQRLARHEMDGAVRLLASAWVIEARR
ncbi:MAG: methyltransferase domain-containing protein [Pseudomonadota bacterium]